MFNRRRRAFAWYVNRRSRGYRRLNMTLLQDDQVESFDEIDGPQPLWREIITFGCIAAVPPVAMHAHKPQRQRGGFGDAGDLVRTHELIVIPLDEVETVNEPIGREVARAPSGCRW